MHFNPYDYTIEPACVRLLTTVRSFNTANFPRNIVTPPNCDGGAYPEGMYGDKVDKDVAKVNATGIKGNVAINYGFNMNLHQLDGTIVVSGDVGKGARMFSPQCSEVPMTEQEQAELDSGKTLSKGPNCNDTLKSINGTETQDISIIGGPGIKVYKDPDDEHGILIDLDETAFSGGCDS